MTTGHDAQDLSLKLATFRLHKDPKVRTFPQSNAWIRPMAKLLDQHSAGHIAAVLDWVYRNGDWENTAKTPAVFKSHFYSIDEAMQLEREVRRSRYNPLLKAIKAIVGRTHDNA